VVGRPTKLFDAIIDTTLGAFSHVHYAPTPDGKRFLVNLTPGTAPPLVVVQNRSVPTGTSSIK
jgi:hypothetical protein